MHQSATRIQGISRLWDGTRVHHDISIVLRGGTVVGIGPEFDDLPVDDVIDADGLIAMPGLVDCHTHTTFAGSRVADFVRRLGGTSYTALLEGGGGGDSADEFAGDDPASAKAGGDAGGGSGSDSNSGDSSNNRGSFLNVNL